MDGEMTVKVYRRLDEGENGTRKGRVQMDGCIRKHLDKMELIRRLFNNSYTIIINIKACIIIVIIIDNMTL